MLRRLRWGVRLAVLAALVAFAWLTRFGTRWPSVYFMTGPSMEPAIAEERLFLTWAPPGELERGDLVIFRLSFSEREFHVLRRVAGLPGDTLAMRGGALFINGDSAPWPYRVIQPAAWRSEFAEGGNILTWGPRVVPADSVYLLADTRDMLGWPDSRFVGPVPRADILAEATRTLRGRRLR